MHAWRHCWHELADPPPISAPEDCASTAKYAVLFLLLPTPPPTRFVEGPAQETAPWDCRDTALICPTPACRALHTHTRTVVSHDLDD